MQENHIHRKPPYLFVNALTTSRGILALTAGYQYYQTRDPLIPGVIFKVNLGLDALDGPFARRYQVASRVGARLEAVADSLNFTLGAGLLAFEWFPSANRPVLTGALAIGYLYLFKTLLPYHKEKYERYARENHVISSKSA